MYCLQCIAYSVSPTVCRLQCVTYITPDNHLITSVPAVPSLLCQLGCHQCVSWVVSSVSAVPSPVCHSCAVTSVSSVVLFLVCQLCRHHCVSCVVAQCVSCAVTGLLLVLGNYKSVGCVGLLVRRLCWVTSP